MVYVLIVCDILMYMKRIPKDAGFTLLEMLIVIVIISILLIVVLFNYRDVENKSILRNIAYEVALTVREAQSYGLGVKKYAPGAAVGGNTGLFEKSYGVQVNTGATEAKTIYLFSDTEIEDGLCSDCTAGTCPGTGECRQSLLLHSGAEIKDICLRGLDYGFEEDVTTSGVTELCTSGSKFYSAAVRFKRPNPDAQFTAIDENDGTLTRSNVTNDIQNGGTMTITLFNPRSPDYVQNIEITTIGQVRVYGDDA